MPPEAKFQSAPPAFTGGDPDRASCPKLNHCFNPRPPLSRGATLASSPTICGIIVSIRAPRFHGGRLSIPAGVLSDNVSIRAARFHDGRRSAWMDALRGLAFQSAPPAFTGGDCGYLNCTSRKGLLAHFRAHGDFLWRLKDFKMSKNKEKWLWH